MYVNPFLCGVVTTIFVEVVGIIVFAIVKTRGGRDGR